MNTPWYSRYRWPLAAVLILAGGARYYAYQARQTMLGERVEVPLEVREQRMREAEERRKAYRPAVAAVDPAQAVDPRTYQTEPMMLYAVLGNGALMRFKFGATNAGARLTEVTERLRGSCLKSGPAAAPAACAHPVDVASESWAALIACTPRAPLVIPNHPTLRVKPAAAHAVKLSAESAALAPAPASPAEGAEVADVIWPAGACPKFAASKATSTEISKLYSLRREAR